MRCLAPHTPISSNTAARKRPSFIMGTEGANLELNNTRRNSQVKGPRQPHSLWKVPGNRRDTDGASACMIGAQISQVADRGARRPFQRVPYCD